MKVFAFRVVLAVCWCLQWPVVTIGALGYLLMCGAAFCGHHVGRTLRKVQTWAYDA